MRRDTFSGKDGKTIVDASADHDRVMRRLRASATVIQPQEAPASGVLDTEVIGWTKFIEAWFKDFSPKSLTPETIEVLKIFVLGWTLHGKSSMEVEVRVGEHDEDVEYQQLEEIPSFTYNPEGKKVIEDLFMTYYMWKSAVGDFKLNTQGASDPNLFGKKERLQWGGPIDMSQDVKLPSVNSALDLFLGED